MKNITIILALIVSIFLTACSTNTTSENKTTGAIAGGVIGGLAGSLVGGGVGKAVAIGAGIVAGALIGGSIGESMDSSDNARMNNVMTHNRVNRSTTWHNSSTGKQYTVTPTSRMMTYNGQSNCRTYRTVAIINGQKQSVNGVACLRSDGTWVAARS